MPRIPALLILVGLPVLAGSAGCDERPAPPAPGATVGHAATASDRAVAEPVTARFVERARDAGIRLTYHNGEEAGHLSILESLGGGVAAFDYDGDGAADLFFPTGGKYGPQHAIHGLPHALFRNVGDWTFVDVSAPAAIAVARHYPHGVAAADYDADGFTDLLVTGYGGLQLFRNQGDGTFADLTDAALLDDPLWSSSAAWGDVNGDGRLDLYIAHYVNWSWENHPDCHGPKANVREVCPPRQFEPLPDTLYLANGDGTFRDASKEAGLRQDGKGLGVVLGDVDLDGDVDIYVANDTEPNFLYRNDGTGHFEEVGHLSGTALSDTGTPDGSMGVALGDFNLDGLPDIWVANYERESCAMYRNEGNCVFQHVSQPLGVNDVGALYVGFGTLFFDFDRDGDEDLFVTNGHVLRHPDTAPVRQVPLLFENMVGKRFRNIAPQAGAYLAAPHLGRGVAAADFDGDGDLDLVVTHTHEPHALLENRTQNENGWLQVRLVGVASNRDAIGARLTLETSAGRQVRQIVGGGSYLSHSDPRPFWGLPRGASLKSLTIRWPSGTVQTLTAIKPHRILTVIEPSAGRDPSPSS